MLLLNYLFHSSYRNAFLFLCRNQTIYDDKIFVNIQEGMHHYFIPSSEFSEYLEQIKVILSTLKKYPFFSLVMDTS